MISKLAFKHHPISRKIMVLVSKKAVSNSKKAGANNHLSLTILRGVCQDGVR